MVAEAAPFGQFFGVHCQRREVSGKGGYDMPFLRGQLGPADIERMAAKRDIEGLIRALDDTRHGSSPEVRQHALEAVISVGGPAVEPLIVALNGRSLSVRANAAVALGHVGDARAVMPLVAALCVEDDPYYLRQGVARALGMLRDPRAIEPLCDAAAMDAYVVVPVLEQFGDAGVTALLARLKSRDSSERRLAAYALQFLQIETNQARCLGLLIAALQDEDSSVRMNAADALHHSRVGGKAVEHALRAAYAAEQDLNTRLKMGAILNDYDEDHTSEASWS
jgi:HEAT repeat protein